MAKFVGEFFPPDLSPAFLLKAAWGALQTFAVSALGTLLAVGAAACWRCPRRAASASRRGSRRGSRSTCCAACPSWCGPR